MVARARSITAPDKTRRGFRLYRATYQNSITPWDKFKVRDLFHRIVTVEDVKKGKPDPEGLFKILNKRSPKHAVYIGDNVDNARAARSAAMPFLGPFRAAAKLANRANANSVALGALHVLGNITDIERWLARATLWNPGRKAYFGVLVRAPKYRFLSTLSLRAVPQYHCRFGCVVPESRSVQAPWLPQNRSKWKRTLSRFGAGLCRSLNILLKFAKMYDFGHPRTVSAYDTAWRELRAAIGDNETGLLLAASGDKLLLDGVTLDTGAAEKSFASCYRMPVSPAFISLPT